MGGDFLARIRLVLEGNEKVVQGLAETQRAAQKLTGTKVTTIFDKKGLATGREIQQTFKQLQPAAGQAATKMGDFERALRRVVIVAPVWMLFRSVIQGTMAIIRDGFKTWEEFDRALIKSKAVIHDFAGTTDEAMIELEDRIRTFSRESGLALKDLASSFYRFGTVGIAFQDALSGAIASAKLAKATLGDVDTVSRSLAMAYRLLGDTIDQSLSPMQKQESLAGKIYHLWKENAFESNEFAQSLNNFISTANIVNFTADQTVAILASLGTAGVQGARGGRLLRTAIQKLLENLDILAPKLGLSVNPELENTFDLFMRVLNAINKLSRTTGIPAEAIKSIQEIFGGVRGGQVVSALNALLPELTKNIEDLGRDPQQFIEGLNERFKEVTSTVSGQLDIFRQLRVQVGESFVKGLVGAKDFKDALVSINMAMETMIDVAGNIADYFKFIARPISSIKEKIRDAGKEEVEFFNKVQDAKEGILSLADTIEVLSEVQYKWENDAFKESTVARIQEVIKYIVEQGRVQEELNKEVDKYNEKVQEAENIEKTKQLSVELQNRLSIIKEEFDIMSLQTVEASDLVIEHKKLDNIVKSMVDKYNDLTDSSGNQVKQITNISVKSAILKGDFEKVLNIFKEMTLTEKELNDLADAYVSINKAVLSDLNKRFSTMTSILKIAGEEETTIIKHEMAMKALMFGEDYLKNSMDDRLRLAQALTKEADAQEKSSSRLVELFKIIKKYGQEVAQEVSNFLGGAKEFIDLSPAAQQAIRKIMPGEFEIATAQEAFKKIPGFKFPEEIERERIRKRDFKIIEDILIEPINIFVDLESEDLIDKIKRRLISALDDKKSELYRKINEQIENF